MKLAAALVVLVASCTGPVTSLDAPEPSAATIARDDVTRDLALTLRTTTETVFERGRDPKLEVVLENRGRRAYPIVMPSDGSEAGWREPHVFYTVEALGRSGAWQQVSPEPLTRCGVYDRDWTKDVVALAPGDRKTLHWFSFYDQWEIGDATRVRIVAHYAYGDHARDRRTVPPSLHDMPTYELASNAVEMTAEEPLVLEMRAKGPLPTREAAPLAPSVEIVLVNRSSRELPLGDDVKLWIELDGSGVVYTDSATPSARAIAPGARIDLASGAQVWLHDGNIGSAKRARAVLSIHDDQNRRIARSPWVELGAH